MNRSVLFVDDEPIVIMSFKRVFRMLGARWEMLFASSAGEALELLSARHVDAVVTDLAMPGMDGAELLRRTMHAHPDTVRVLLSGYTEQEMLGRDLAPAHQFFSKPCDEKRLLQALEQAMNAREYVTNQLVLEKIGLPVMPEVARLISFELERERPDIEKIADIVASDADTALAIQRFAGIAQGCGKGADGSPRQAVRAIGANVILPVVLFEFLFSRFERESVQSFSPPMLRSHCLRTSVIARAIALDMALDPASIDCACAAGLLHDVGKLLLDVLYGPECLSIMETVRADNRRVSEVEQERLGLTHAQVGAYLLGLLGLPEPVVRSVAGHHEPRAENRGFHHENAVYIANFLDHSEFIINQGYARPVPAPARLADIGDGERMRKWKELVRGLEISPVAA